MKAYLEIGPLLSFSQMYPAKRAFPKLVAVLTKELLELMLTDTYDWPEGVMEQAPEKPSLVP